MLVDSHCHLDRLENNLSTTIASAHENGVRHMLCVCIDMNNFPAVLKTAEQYAFVSASVGVHPTEQEGHEPSMEELVQLANHPKVVAIGETGLDYFRSEGELDWQRDRFRRHIQAAKRSQKPLIVHTREARDDTIAILKEESAENIGGVMHCFTEDLTMAKKAMDLNFYISFSGIVTFKNATSLQEVAKKIPLDKMLIETDSPYLAPVPFRGKPNEPAYVKYVAACIAELRGISFEEVAKQTTTNFFNLFTHAQPMDLHA